MTKRGKTTGMVSSQPKVFCKQHGRTEAICHQCMMGVISQNDVIRGANREYEKHAETYMAALNGMKRLLLLVVHEGTSPFWVEEELKLPMWDGKLLEDVTDEQIITSLSQWFARFIEDQEEEAEHGSDTNE